MQYSAAMACACLVSACTRVCTQLATHVGRVSISPDGCSATTRYKHSTYRVECFLHMRLTAYAGMSQWTYLSSTVCIPLCWECQLDFSANDTPPRLEYVYRPACKSLNVDDCSVSPNDICAYLLDSCLLSSGTVCALNMIPQGSCPNNPCRCTFKMPVPCTLSTPSARPWSGPQRLHTLYNVLYAEY